MDTLWNTCCSWFAVGTYTHHFCMHLHVVCFPARKHSCFLTQIQQLHPGVFKCTSLLLYCKGGSLPSGFFFSTMTQLSFPLLLRVIHFLGQTCTKNGNYIWVSQNETFFFYSWERAVTPLCEISCFNKFSQYNRCRLSLCFTCVSTVARTVSIAHYVALINLITVQHAQREREDSAGRLITLWEGVSTWLSMLFHFEVLLCSPSSTPLSHLFMHQHKHTHTNQWVHILYAHWFSMGLSDALLPHTLLVSFKYACGISKILINTK